MTALLNPVFNRDPTTGVLACEAVPLDALAAAFGTPTYVYSRRAIAEAVATWQSAWSILNHATRFSVKATSNIAILQLMTQLGVGFDLVSGGELARVIQAGGDPRQAVFSGVGKTESELTQALQAGIESLHVESEAELHMIAAAARALGVRAPVSLRLNPDIDPQTHHHIATGLADAKFGIAWDDAPRLIAQTQANPHLRLVGLTSHIGSQLTDITPLISALDRVLSLIVTLGLDLDHLDIGGGLGVTYRDERPPSPATYATAVRDRLAAHGLLDLKILTEPGRALTAHAAALLTRVTLKKPHPNKTFVVVDAGMNDLMRPALYDAWHGIVPIAPPDPTLETIDLVGPICETADIFARARPTPRLAPGDLIALTAAGAYGMTMASQYNSRPRPAEVLIDGATPHLIRERESFTDLIRGEYLIDTKSTH